MIIMFTRRRNLLIEIDKEKEMLFTFGKKQRKIHNEDKQKPILSNNRVFDCFIAVVQSKPKHK